MIALLAAKILFVVAVLVGLLAAAVLCLLITIYVVIASVIQDLVVPSRDVDRNSRN